MTVPTAAVTASPIRDSGLQAERTALAWNRTGLALLVNAMLTLRSGWAGHAVALTLAGIAMLLAAAAAIYYGAWRRHHLLSDQPMIAPSAAAIGIAALITLLACVAGIASVLVPHP